MTRVFFVEKATSARVDISSAQKYGKVVYLSEQLTWNGDDELTDKLTHLLESFNFDPSEDYVAATGSIGTVACFAVVLGSLYGRVQLLYYFARDEEYRPILIGEAFDNE